MPGPTRSRSRRARSARSFRRMARPCSASSPRTAQPEAPRLIVGAPTVTAVDGEEIRRRARCSSPAARRCRPRSRCETTARPPCSSRRCASTCPTGGPPHRAGARRARGSRRVGRGAVHDHGARRGIRRTLRGHRLGDLPSAVGVVGEHGRDLGAARRDRRTRSAERAGCRAVASYLGRGDERLDEADHRRERRRRQPHLDRRAPSTRPASAWRARRTSATTSAGRAPRSPGSRASTTSSATSAPKSGAATSSSSATG